MKITENPFGKYVYSTGLILVTFLFNIKLSGVHVQYVLGLDGLHMEIYQTLSQNSRFCETRKCHFSGNIHDAIKMFIFTYPVTNLFHVLYGSRNGWNVFFLETKAS